MGFLKKSWRALCAEAPPSGEERNIGELETGLLKDNQQRGQRCTMRLNAGEDDEMEVGGYRKHWLKRAIITFFTIATAGFLQLVFHWVPRWRLKANCVKCDIAQAESLLITELYNNKHKIYFVKDLKVLTPDIVRKMKNDDNLIGKDVIDVDEMHLSVHFGNGTFAEVDKLILFTCKKVTYFWHPQKNRFVKLRGLDESVTSETLHSDKNGLTKAEQFMRLLVYNPNDIAVKETPLLTLLVKQVLDAYYIFQLFSFTLWFIDDYYYYAGTILTLSIISIAVNIRIIRTNERNLRATVQSSDVCVVLRPVHKVKENGSGDSIFETELISTKNLVPGDILEIPANGCVMHCDAVLLTGTCIVNEAMLTGESVPVTKTPLPKLTDYIYEPKEHARHTLFCGTHVIQTRYFGDEKVLARVVRTGFSTAKGALVRSILYPPPADFKFEKDSYKFIGVLACIAGLGFIYTVIAKVSRGVPIVNIVLQSFDLITIVVPPALPAALSASYYAAQKRLRTKLIYCIAPKSITVAGSIDCICFDKTGTLTEDGLDLLCVVPVQDRKFVKPVKNVETLPHNKLLGGLVSCHSLTVINKQITGDPLDLKMFESTKWSLEEPDVSDNSKFNVICPTVFKPPKDRAIISQGDDFETEIGVIKEFPFSSSLQRMGVIIRKLGAQNFEYYCKGSPEMVLNFVDGDSVPSNLDEVLESFTHEGYRVIALAHRELKNVKYTKLQKLQREDIETNMTFLGLIVLENRLKEDTTPSINMLNDAKMKIVMVTGDNILTALSVARDCGIVTSGQSVIMVNCEGENTENPNLVFTLATAKSSTANQDMSLLSNSNSIASLDTLESQIVTNGTVVNNDLKRPQSVYNDYRFAITGKVWAIVRDYYPELVPKLITRGSVFARMSPEQKQQLVQELQMVGYYVAMCGDGANDCGALKAAHTGISLSEAESSVASPFTSKIANITCVAKVIREGRGALVTSCGIFKFMAGYSLLQFASVMILYEFDSNLTDVEFLYIDLPIITAVAFFFAYTRAYSGPMVPEAPPNSLISFSPICSLVMHLILALTFQVIALETLKAQDWYVPFNGTEGTDKDDVACYENYTIFSVSQFQYIIIALVFSKGYPYRKSFFTNYGLLSTVLCLVGISTFLLFAPVQSISEFVELQVPDSIYFKWFLLGLAVVNGIFSFGTEYLVDYVYKQLRVMFYNVDKSERKFLAIEKRLDEDAKWPPLSSNFRSAASPLTPSPTQQYTTEIVIETEKPVDSNYVLKGLLENNQYESAASNRTTPYHLSSAEENSLPALMETNLSSLRSLTETSEYNTPSLLSSTQDPFMTTSDLLNDVFDSASPLRDSRSRSHQGTPYRSEKPERPLHSIHDIPSNPFVIPKAVISKNGNPDVHSVSMNGLDSWNGSSFNAMGRNPPAETPHVAKNENNLELDDMEGR